MRKIELTWDQLEEVLKKNTMIMEDDRTIERIEQVTLVKPRTILIHTKEVKK